MKKKAPKETTEELTKRTREIIRKLKRAYPGAKCSLNHSNPFELLVATILSAQCTDDRVNIVTDRDTGRARGFAFVEMSSEAEGTAAINGLNGRDLDGRTLNINEARPKTDRGGNGGGGGARRQNRW